MTQKKTIVSKRSVPFDGPSQVARPDGLVQVRYGGGREMIRDQLYGWPAYANGEAIGLIVRRGLGEKATYAARSITGEINDIWHKTATGAVDQLLGENGL